MAKLMRFEAQVFVGNELRQKVLKGPSDFKSWTDCWRVFRSAMLCLKAASPQTLDNYYRGVEQLTIMYPNAWGLIFCADELMRSEGWDKLREELEDEDEWPTQLPWDTVIRMSTYGKGDPDQQHWWFTHVVALATQGGGGRSVVVAMENSTNLPAQDGLYGNTAQKGGGFNVHRGRRGGGQHRKAVVEHRRRKETGLMAKAARARTTTRGTTARTKASRAKARASTGASTTEVSPARARPPSR